MFACQGACKRDVSYNVSRVGQGGSNKGGFERLRVRALKAGLEVMSEGAQGVLRGLSEPQISARNRF